MRRALTGVESDVFGFDLFEPDELFPALFAGGLFSVDLFATGVGVDFGRFRGGLVVDAEVAGFSLGREVRNAPRTSP